MAISDRLKAFLQSAKVKYSVMKHPVVYTAQEIAGAQHVPGRQLAKCVLVKTEHGPVLAVLPAIHLIDLKKLKALLGAKTLSIAKEADIKQAFPDVEIGAMSPFGNLYEVRVVVDRQLGEAGEIVFNAGTHTETIKMRYQDFTALAKPKTGPFGQALPKQKAPARKPAAKKSHKSSARPKTKKKPAARRRK